jgi:hypothetical protein
MLALAGCRVGLPPEEDECEPMRDDLPGTWRSACIFLESRQNEDEDDENIFFRDTYSFVDSNDFTREYHEFADIDCLAEAERLAVFARGTYEIGADFASSSQGLDVCGVDFDYEAVNEEVDEDDTFEEPDTPFAVFDILYLLPPEPDDDVTPGILFTGDLEGPFIENTETERPDAINLLVEYLRQ